MEEKISILKNMYKKYINFKSNVFQQTLSFCQSFELQPKVHHCSCQKLPKPVAYPNQWQLFPHLKEQRTIRIIVKLAIWTFEDSRNASVINFYLIRDYKFFYN